MTLKAKALSGGFYFKDETTLSTIFLGFLLKYLSIPAVFIFVYSRSLMNGVSANAGSGD